MGAGLLSICEYAEAILVAILLALFAKAFVFEAFDIPSGSMEGTLLVGDHVVVDKLLFAPHRGPWKRLLPYRELTPGDVVVFKSKDDPSVDLVKRIAAVGGDTVRITRKRLFRNGTAVDEPWATFRDSEVYGSDAALPGELRTRDELAELTVPPGTFFALGDNRDGSRDSRVWGCVPFEHVKGRPVFVYWSRTGPDSSEIRTSGRGAALRQAIATALHLFDRTRWRRTFRVVR
jgi:signal peptidase I